MRTPLKTKYEIGRAVRRLVRVEFRSLYSRVIVSEPLQLVDETRPPRAFVLCLAVAVKRFSRGTKLIFKHEH